MFIKRYFYNICYFFILLHLLETFFRFFRSPSPSFHIRTNGNRHRRTAPPEDRIGGTVLQSGLYNMTISHDYQIDAHA